jgi:hypothetical protein
MTTQLDAHTIRRIAVEAKRAPRTVLRWLNGERGKSTADAAIAEAVERLGLAPREDGPAARERLAAGGVDAPR